VDEVNLLDDHVVDVLLDSAAMGVNTIEREGISFSHQARFTLVGTMNPEEGELRPQLLDRFGLCVNIEGIRDIDQRIEVVKRRSAYEAVPVAFSEKWSGDSKKLMEEIVAATDIFPQVSITDSLLRSITVRSLDAGVDGHRSDIVMLKAAKTIAALHHRSDVIEQDIAEAAELVLPHRVRRRPFDEILTPSQKSGSKAKA
jgi:Mg-chelatase subunit ChlI